MGRVLTLIGSALFFIGYPSFSSMRSPKVVLVLKRLIYRVLSVQPSSFSRSVDKFSPAATRSGRPCHSAVAILFAHESEAKMKSVTRVVTVFSLHTSHASGMEA